MLFLCSHFLQLFSALLELLLVGFSMFSELVIEGVLVVHLGLVQVLSYLQFLFDIFCRLFFFE